MKEAHPSEGDTLVLTDTLYDKTVIGTGLPSNSKLANKDERFDAYEVTVVDVSSYSDDVEYLTLQTEDGNEVTARYRGKCRISPSTSISVSNSQNANQKYIWEFK